MKVTMGECDGCGEWKQIRQCWFGPMETWQCDACTDSEDDDLRYATETGESNART